MELIHKNEIKLSLIAVIACTFIFSVSNGVNVVIFPLTLQGRGLSSSYVGIAESVAYFCGLLLTPFIATMVRVIGKFRILLFITIVRAMIMCVYPFTTSFTQWLGLQMLMGFAGLTYFIILQSWVLNTAPKHKHGVMLGIFAATYSGGIAFGPIILKFITPEGSLPFFVSSAIFASSVIPLYLGRKTIPKIKEVAESKMLAIIKESPIISAAKIVCDFTYTSITVFIVLYGIYSGLSVTAAAFLVTAFMAGSIFFDIVAGAVSDKVNRRKMMHCSIFLSMLCAVSLPFSIDNGYWAWVVLFIWNGAIGGAFVSSMSLIGQRYKGANLVSANSSMVLAGGIASMFGGLIPGFAMDIFKPNGLVYVIIAMSLIYFIFVTIITLIRRRAQNDS